MIGLGRNPGLRRGTGNTSVRGVRVPPRLGTDTEGEQFVTYRPRAQKWNHNVYKNHDRETKVAEFLTLLLRIMRVPGSNLVPDPATRIATVYLITLQAGVATVLQIIACQHACKHSRLHYALHSSSFHTTVRTTTTNSSFIRSVCLTNERPTSSSNGVVWCSRPTETVGRLRLRKAATTLERSDAQTSSNNVGEIRGSDK